MLLVRNSAMYDCIVVGAGVIGSWTACMLAERGNKVLVVEQFSLLHSRGSSFGDIRDSSIFFGDALELEMTNISNMYWRKLNEDSGECLSWTLPFVEVCDESGFKRQEELQNRIPDECEWLDGEQLRQRCTAYRFPLNYRGLMQKSSLAIKASSVLAVLQERFRQLGGHFAENFKVEKVVPGPDIEVIGPTGSYKSRTLAVCAGPWSQKFLSQLGLDLPLVCKTLLKQYFKVKDGYGSIGSLKSDTYSDDGLCLGYYTLETSPGCLRIVVGDGPETEPDKRDNVNVDDILRRTQEHVKKYWPGLHDKPYKVVKCIYTLTPDFQLICDRHPNYSNVVFAAGFSGGGFRYSPAVGELIADLIENKSPQINYDAAKVGRFKESYQVT